MMSKIYIVFANSLQEIIQNLTPEELNGLVPVDGKLIDRGCKAVILRTPFTKVCQNKKEVKEMKKYKHIEIMNIYELDAKLIKDCEK